MVFAIEITVEKIRRYCPVWIHGNPCGLEVCECAKVMEGRGVKTRAKLVERGGEVGGEVREGEGRGQKMFAAKWENVESGSVQCLTVSLALALQCLQ